MDAKGHPSAGTVSRALIRRTTLDRDAVYFRILHLRLEDLPFHQVGGSLARKGGVFLEWHFESWNYSWPLILPNAVESTN